MGGIRLWLSVIALITAACAGSSSTTSTIAGPVTTQPASTGESTTTTGEPPVETTSAAPSTTESPSTPAPLMRVVGDEETVFDWTTDRCDDSDIPDLPARAFRAVDGQVTLITAHTESRRSTGPSLDQLVRQCEPVFESTRDPDPAQWSDSEWLASTWTPDGTTVYGLVHNEFHGWERGDCAGMDPFQCWYNGITAVASTDGGATFRYISDPPNHLVASIPHQYIPETAAVGLFSPSNIVLGPEDHWYALGKMGAHRTGRQTVCLMRTPDLADPSAWRFWDGSAFEGEFIDPYAVEAAAPRDHACPALDPDDIGAQMVESLTWNSSLERWVLVGISADTIEGREVWGFYYSFSGDLIDWTRRQLLLEVPLPWTVSSSGSDLSYLYPSLLDPASESLNFETTGSTAYLYFTRHNSGQGSLDRDLVRVPVEFAFED